MLVGVGIRTRTRTRTGRRGSGRGRGRGRVFWPRFLLLLGVWIGGPGDRSAVTNLVCVRRDVVFETSAQEWAEQGEGGGGGARGGRR